MPICLCSCWECRFLTFGSCIALGTAWGQGSLWSSPGQRWKNRANVIFFLQPKPRTLKILWLTSKLFTHENEKSCSDIRELAWHSQVDCGAFLMTVNDFTEHQHQTKPLCDRDESRWKQDCLKIMSEHRQKQEHYPKHKMTNYSPIRANRMMAPSLPIIALT